MFAGDVMGRKGFTLVELIATIVISSLVIGFATYGVIGIINNSKNKSEEIFVDKLEVAIEEFIELESRSFNKYNTLEVPIKKCVNSSCSGEFREVEVSEYYYNDKKNNVVRNLYLNDLVDENLFDDNRLINPVNKLDCLNNVNPIIRVFKDSD